MFQLHVKKLYQEVRKRKKTGVICMMTRDERLKGKGLMKPSGVTNLGAQVGGCAPDTQPR